MNKEKLGQAVMDKVNQLEKEFQDRDDRVQKIVESEQSLSSSKLNNHIVTQVEATANVQNLLKMDTSKFI